MGGIQEMWQSQGGSGEKRHFWELLLVEVVQWGERNGWDLLGPSTEHHSQGYSPSQNGYFPAQNIIPRAIPTTKWIFPTTELHSQHTNRDERWRGPITSQGGLGVNQCKSLLFSLGFPPSLSFPSQFSFWEGGLLPCRRTISGSISGSASSYSGSSSRSRSLSRSLSRSHSRSSSASVSHSPSGSRKSRYSPEPLASLFNS